MVPQYREGSSFTEYRKKDEKPDTVGLDDTAIPHIKINITEITLEKMLNTVCYAAKCNINAKCNKNRRKM